jgi:hypothetical protein
VESLQIATDQSHLYKYIYILTTKAFQGKLLLLQASRVQSVTSQNSAKYCSNVSWLLSTKSASGPFYLHFLVYKLMAVHHMMAVIAKFLANNTPAQ